MGLKAEEMQYKIYKKWNRLTAYKWYSGKCDLVSSGSIMMYDSNGNNFLDATSFIVWLFPAPCFNVMYWTYSTCEVHMSTKRNQHVLFTFHRHVP